MFMDNFDEASEEIKKRRKKRAIKVFITESLMVVAVICLVVLTTMIATGYNVKPSDDGLIERTGLVAIQTIPTGANIAIDGEEIFGWTNLSRSMTQGEHEIKLYKDGYGSWMKKINVTAGLYYRLNYPRLFLSERTENIVEDFSEIKQVSFAKDGDLMLAIPKESLKWQLWKINEEKPTMTELNIKKAFPDANTDLFVGMTIEAWSGSSQRVLARLQNSQWVLIDVKNPEKSLNLSEKFGFDFSAVKIANDSATEMYVLENDNLRLIDIDDNKISGILIEDVESFYNAKSNLVYVTIPNEKHEFETGFYSKNNKERVVLSQYTFSEEKPKVLIAIGEYYGEYYVLEFVNDQAGVYSGNKLPSSGDEETLKPISVEEIGFVPETVNVMGNGGLFVAENGLERAVFDIETMNFEEYFSDSKTAWLDEFMLYENRNGELVVEDFDGENEVRIAEDLKVGSEVKISKNNKWIYFVSDENNLSRVRILE